MIKDARNRIVEIGTRAAASEENLKQIFINQRKPDRQETESDLLKKLADMLDESLLTVSAMTTHYKLALEHQKRADKAVSAAGVSEELAIGRTIVSLANDIGTTMAEMPSNDAGANDRLEELKNQQIAYKQLENAKVRAEMTISENIGPCLDELLEAQQITQTLKEIL